MQLVSSTSPDQAREAAVTRRLVEEIAREVWRLHGRNGTLNWVWVERHLGGIVERAQSEARVSRAAPGSKTGVVPPPTDRAGRPGHATRTGVQGDEP